MKVCKRWERINCQSWQGGSLESFCMKGETYIGNGNTCLWGSNSGDQIKNGSFELTEYFFKKRYRLPEHIFRTTLCLLPVFEDVPSSDDLVKLLEVPIYNQFPDKFLRGKYQKYEHSFYETFHPIYSQPKNDVDFRSSLH